MTQEEKTNNPNSITTWWYLKPISYKEAWKNAWNWAELSEKKKVLDLPNFDNDIFLDITGINVKKELNIK